MSMHANIFDFVHSLLKVLTGSEHEVMVRISFEELCVLDILIIIISSCQIHGTGC